MRRTLALLVLLPVLAGCSRERSATIEIPKGPVIIVSIDTLRADRLPAWGYRNVETPAIDRLARAGIVFENAWSHVPLTLPSHVSALTGRLPWEHGVRNNIGYRYDPASAPSVVEALRGAGFSTGGAVSAYVLRGDTGISHGFDAWDDRIASQPGAAQGRLQRPGAETSRSALEWIGSQGSRPFFFFLHLFEPHAPYEAPEPFRSRWSDPYDAEIAAVDSVLGDFLDELEQKGIYDRATIILMSDHGEGLGDHGEAEHGVFLYREAIHVPLIVKLPDGLRGGTRVERNVQIADVAATVAQVAGITFPSSGRSLLATEVPERAIYAETWYPRIHLGWSELRSLVSGSHHYIEAPSPELYDMAIDPDEKNNVLMNNRRVFAALRTELESIPKELTAPAEVDSEEAAKLAALGYIGTARDRSDGPLPDPKDGIADLDRMKQAFAAAGSGDVAGAIAMLETLLSGNPRLTDAWNKLGSLHEIRGDYEAAIAAYKSAASNEPSLAAEYSLSIAANLYRLEKHDEALAHLELARPLNPSGALLLESRIALARGDVATAEAKARTVAADSTHGIAGKVLLAEVLTAKGSFDEAMRVAAEVDAEARRRGLPPVDNLNFILGDLHARRGDIAKAEAHFLAEIGAYPAKRQTYANLALLYMLAGRTADARRTIEEMTRANPSADTYRFAAHTMETLGDADAAARWRARASE